MVRELIRRGRTCPEAERGELARMLARHARAGSDAAFSELCRMAGGGGRTLFARYSPRDQITGIKALGRTGRKDALAMLRSWQVYAEVYTESCTGLACGSDHMPRWTALAYVFPAAPRRLGDRLRYMGPQSPPEHPPASLSPEAHDALRAENPYHVAVSRAVSRLAAAAQKS